MTSLSPRAVPSTCWDEDLRAVLRGLLTTIGDKWSLAVVSVLVDGPVRFTEIQRRVNGISHRLLTKTLRDLERDGLVSRTVHAEVPPRVEYALTPMGESLLRPIDALVQWVEEHGPIVLANRAVHGARSAAGDPSR